MENSGEYLYRRLDVTDYEELVSLWRRSGLSFRPRGRDTKEAMSKEMTRDETLFLGIFDKDRLIGSILATSDGRKGWLNRLAIDPDYRGRGLALKLISEGEKFLFDSGLMIIAVLIEEDNKPSQELFAKASYIFGRDILYFSKRLNDDV